MKTRKLRATAQPLKIDLTRKDVETVKRRWRWTTDSLDEIAASNVLQYLTPVERIHFMNEAFRVLKATGKLMIVPPHWASGKAYGDLDAVMPPVSEAWFFFLDQAWRKVNTRKETRYHCDFVTTWGYGLHPLLVSRNQEYQQHALKFFKEAAQDLVATLSKRS